MLIHPQFDPVAFSLGPLAVRWYGLMYLAGFFCFWLLGRRRSSELWRGISGEDLENLLFYGIFGVILGAVTAWIVVGASALVRRARTKA